MDASWITTSWSSLLMVVISTIGIYVALIILTRLIGLRSFSKMSSFDFAVTVAFGSIIASSIMTKKPPLILSAVALAALFVIQYVVAKMRGNSSFMSTVVDNEPLLLMRGKNILDENLRKAAVTRGDLRGKLREANVTQLHQVHAVIMEATGDISVMHNDDPDHDLDDELLKGVRGWED